jgi:aspartyl-tRNA(Asn)/glutamyl-tRNA(Gln) amidotransferase subunit A
LILKELDILELCELTAHALADLLAKREISAEEITSSVLKRIEMSEESLHCYLHRDNAGATATAQAVDAKRLAGETVAPWAGIPIAVMDNLSTAGMPTTCASKMLQDYAPPFDATVVSKVKAMGMPLLGKTNLDEFNLGASTESSAFGPTHNPWRTERVPGGPAGGSAAAVAAGEAIWSLASSHLGPASYCGVVGMKPTYGRVSRFGLISSSSLDQAGPLTRDVYDCATLLNIMAGYDALDTTSINAEAPDFTAQLDAGVKGTVIGIPSEYFASDLAADVKAAVMQAVKVLENQGAQVVEVSLPHTRYALATYAIIAAVEASSGLGRYDGVRYGYRSANTPNTNTMFSNTRGEGFGPAAKLQILLGTYSISAGHFADNYLKATKVRTLIIDDFDQAFTQCDVLATPTMPSVAFRLGEQCDDPVRMNQVNCYRAPADLAGLPAISIPCGLSNGLPVGLQLIGPALAEQRLLQAAYTYEQAAGLKLSLLPMEVR